jgi:hypothetical protein
MVVLARILTLATITLLAAASDAATYYVDAVHGADTNHGTASESAWKSMDRVNHATFKPGDRVLFHGGEKWHGQLAPISSGADGRPIVFDRYGDGDLPLLDGDGTIEDTVLLRNIEQVEVRHLAITNHGTTPAVRRGVDVLLDDFGTAHHIVLADLYIHDVNGVDEHKDNGGILFRARGRTKPSRFDDLLIERNVVWKVDRSGIAGESSSAMRTNWFPSLHVVIRDNYVDDIGGDGIVPQASVGTLVDGNVARRCNQRSTGFNAGIWQWSTDDTLLTMNEAFETKGTRDGEGFDSDYNSRNTHFLHNYSHDNDGGFMLICTPVTRKQESNLGNTGSIIEQNISHNDHGLLINLSGADDVVVRDNLFLVGANRDVRVLVSDWSGWSSNAQFSGNSFVSDGTITFGHSLKRLDDGSYNIAPGWGPARNIVFSNNKYFGHLVNPPLDASSSNAPPPSSNEDVRWSEEPIFDPANPSAYPLFVRAHRMWMSRLFESTFRDKGPQ